MRRPQCQREKPGDARFCTGYSSFSDLMGSGCGKSLPLLTTLQLEHGSVTRRSYTPKHLAERILISRTALEEEWKPVTVLFCDLASPTSLAERLGPEVMQTLLNQFFERSAWQRPTGMRVRPAGSWETASRPSWVPRSPSKARLAVKCSGSYISSEV